MVLKELDDADQWNNVYHFYGDGGVYDDFDDDDDDDDI